MLPNMECLAEAAKRLGIPLAFLDEHKNFARLELPTPLHFIATATPFNDEGVSKICRDKEYAHLLLHGRVNMPRSLAFVDPDCPYDFAHDARWPSREFIADAITTALPFPVIIKRNGGSQGRNVFIARDRHEVLLALAAVYDHTSSHYDHVALAQERIDIAAEYRVVTFRDRVMLAYERNGAAAMLTDEALLQKFRDMLAAIRERMRVDFAGLDIAVDTRGELQLLELNTKPGFTSFVRAHGPEPLTQMYIEVLSSCR